MTQYLIGIVVVWIFLLPVYSPALAVDVHIRDFHLAEQLSHREINSIYQDQKGFLWIGTRFGLDRYDGGHLKLYVNNSSAFKHAISDDFVTSVFVDSQGTLWAGTRNSGLNMYLPEVDGFKHFRNDPNDETSISHDYIQTIFEDTKGNVWIGTSNGLNLFVRADLSFRQFHVPVSDENTNMVSTITQTSANHILVGIRKVGLRFFNINTMEYDDSYLNDFPPAQKLDGKAVSRITSDSEGNVWIGTHCSGLYKFDRNLNLLTNWKHNPEDRKSLASDKITAILVEAHGLIWIGTEKGLYSMKPDGSSLKRQYFQSTTHKRIKNRSINTLFRDEGGIIWIGTEFGIYLIDNNHGRFSTITYPEKGFQESDICMVYDIYPDIDNTVYTGSIFGGFSVIDKEAEKILPATSNESTAGQLAEIPARQIRKDYRGNYWIGTYIGLHQYDPDSGKIVVHQIPGDDVRSDIRLLEWEDKHHLWVGTVTAGLLRFNINSHEFEPFEPIQNVAKNKRIGIYDILRDSDDSLWIGTYYKLIHYNEKTGETKVYDRDPIDPVNTQRFEALSLFKSSDGHIWIGSTFGLKKYLRESDSFETYLLSEGQKPQRVYSIEEDGLGRLWMGTHIGLTVFNPENEKMKHFTTKDGLGFREFNSRASCQTKDGRMYFGGTKGVISFDPLDFRINDHIPQLSLTNVRIYEEEVKLQSDPIYLDELQFDYDDKYISLRFAVLDFANPENNQLSYKLEGYKDSWVNNGTKHSISFTHLPGGSYTLRVIGSNNDGIWNDEGISLRLTVEPPYWSTIWFQAMILLVTGAVAAMVFLARNISIKRKNQQLNELNRELNTKVSEITSLNDELKAFDYSVSNALRTPIRHIHNFSELLLMNSRNLPGKEDKRYLRKIVSSVEDLWKMIDSLLTLSKVKNTNLDITEVDLSRIARVVANDMEKQYRHANRKFLIEDSITVSGDIILLKMALEYLFDNACKYSQEKETSIIELGSFLDDGMITVYVKDNGAGFDSQRKEKLFVPFHSYHTDDDFEGQGLSLSIVERIIKRHDGTIRAESDGENGATFYFTLPAIN